MSDTRQCVICQTEYDYCPGCPRYSHLPSWMFMFHNENCKNIWGVINGYRAGTIDAKKAKQELSKLDLSKRDTFKPFYQDMIKKICSEAEPKKTEEAVKMKPLFNKK